MENSGAMPMAMYIFLIVYLGLIGLMIVTSWKICVKAGQPGWVIFIPIYNIIVFLKIIGVPWWHLFLCFLIIPMFVFMFTWNIKLAKKFGKGIGFAMGLVFFPIIFYPVLAFTDAKYKP